MKIMTNADILIKIDCLSRVNYALQQNGIPVFYRMTIQNQTDKEIRIKQAVFRSNPEIFKPFALPIGNIEPGRTAVVEMNSLPIFLNAAFLAELTERVAGTVDVELVEEGTNGEDVPIPSQSIPIFLYAADEWCGKVLPAVLAAFVTPNIDIIGQLQKETADILAKRTGDGGLDGYQRNNPRRCLEVVRAAYEAVMNQKLRYAVPPASFERDGQRIRFADRIFRERCMTCLDSSVLYAGLLEACGLNPVIVLEKGHAYTGCHLTDYQFSESFVDDLQMVRKYLQLDELTFFETTMANDPVSAPFSEAEKCASDKVRAADGSYETSFAGLIDVKRARLEQIHALPLKRNESGIWIPDPEVRKVECRLPNEPLRTLREEVAVDYAAERKQERIDRWKQRLLDLSRRNKLLNFRETRQSVQINFPEPAVLEDRLSANTVFSVLPSPLIFGMDDPRYAAQLAALNGADPKREFLMKEFERKRLYVRDGMDAEDLNKSLLTIYRQAQSDMLEGGINTLFLALGMVKWQDPKDRKDHKAPLLLIPMKLNRKSVKEGFFLERADEDTVFNVTLLEMLRIDFNKTIRGIDPANLPADDAGIDVPQIFQIFRQEIKDLAGWELLETEVQLGIFSFQKAVMWEDLNSHIGELSENRVVDHLMNHPAERFDDQITEVKPEEIDTSFSCADLVTPLSADSSQLAAVLSAEKGKNFVLYGPPGTGKSQTIANIIAHCLFKGKSVLFVAEKRAALEVVHQRLSRIGLKPFCLELHSNKSGKRQVLDQFDEALKMTAPPQKGDWAQTASDLQRERDILNDYAAKLHQVYPNGLSAWRALSFLISRSELGERFRLPLFPVTVLSLDAERVRYITETLPGTLTAAYKVLPESAWTELKEIRAGLSGYAAINEVRRTAQELRARTEQVKRTAEQIAYRFQLVPSFGRLQETAALGELGRRLSAAACELPHRFYAEDWDTVSPCIAELLRTEKGRSAALKALAESGWAFLRNAGTKTIGERAAESRRDARFTVEISEVKSRSAEGMGGEDTAALRQKAAELADAVDGLYRLAAVILRGFGLAQPPKIKEPVIIGLLRIAEALKQADPLSAEMFDADWEKTAESAGEAVRFAHDIDIVRQKVETDDFSKLIFHHLDRLKKVYQRGVKFSFLGFFRNRALKKFRKVVKGEFCTSFESIPELLSQFEECRRKQECIDGKAALMQSRFPRFWNDGRPDWGRIDEQVQAGNRIAEAVGAMIKAEDIRRAVMKNIGLRWKELLSGQDELGSAVAVFSENVQKYDLLFRAFASVPAESLPKELTQDGQSAGVSAPAVNLGGLVSAFEGLLAILPDYRAAAANADSLPVQKKGGTVDFEKLEVQKSAVDEIDSALRGLPEASFGKGIGQVRDAVGMILASSDYQTRLGGLTEEAELVSDGCRGLVQLYGKLAKELELRSDESVPFLSLDLCGTLADKILNNSETLEYWFRWNVCRKEAESAGFGFLTAELAEKRISPDETADLMKYSVYRRFAEEVLSRVPVLGGFLESHFERLRSSFSADDAKYFDLARNLIAAKLVLECRNRISAEGADKELGFLRRELSKKMRHKPVRQLIESLPNLLTALKPCLLMSPISAAQYLPVSRTKFDVVVFDEASQIPTCDAVGAIARGNQLIVVGDPKQLPPTRFFQRNRDDDTVEEEEIEELESILDECLTAQIHEVHLRWHYRSRHESLIAFSNHYYYDNNLFTFPAAETGTGQRGVSFHYVENGCYEKSGSRTNPAEAEELVDDVVRCLSDPAFRGKSLGIVTFNEAQKQAIDDLLETARQEHPEIEPFFDDTADEPVFVKNLENVQGDERDVIYFSIGYGPDRNGKISMNFGPLNNDGGERRLNVAVTRAKERVVLFSSLHASDIDLSRTSKLGPRGLKAYLEYAEQGVDVLPIQNAGQETEKSLFEKEIADFLSEAGYAVRSRVGCSKYKVDLAVANPNQPEEYLAGIECDGTSYRQSATARDRDILRQQVLEGLGWKIIHVWSTHWFKNRKNAEEKLLGELKALQK